VKALLLVDIQSDENRLTRKIQFVTLNLSHGKAPFGSYLCGNKRIAENVRLAFFYG
jgi:hypothetical protein